MKNKQGNSLYLKHYDAFLDTSSQKAKEFIREYNKELLDFLDLHGLDALRERLKKGVE